MPVLYVMAKCVRIILKSVTLMYTLRFWVMKKKNNTREDLSIKLEKGFALVRERLIEYEKKNNGYLIISDKDGNIKRVAAKDL